MVLHRGIERLQSKGCVDVVNKENAIGYVLSTVVVIAAFIGISTLIDVMNPWEPSKMDGNIRFADGEVYVGHDKVLEVCRENHEICEELYMGCGAVNCDCTKANKT